MLRHDDLKRIQGITAGIEIYLKQIGHWSYDRIAKWHVCDVDDITERLKCAYDRIIDERWVEQAQALSEGRSTDYSIQYDAGKA